MSALTVISIAFTIILVALAVFVYLAVKELCQLRKDNIELKRCLNEKELILDSLLKNETDLEEDDFSNKFNTIMESKYSDPDFGVNEMAAEMAMSRSTLYEKFSEISETTINNYMKSFRLRKSLEFLSNSKLMVEEIAYMCGFRDPCYFSRIFKKEYGVTPKEYKSRATK